ncbi:pollen receptor-like kinase 1 [Tanacetum coccineum]|uniref:Pollen receptor-like kinase 1 n=1 Tax=Tanacetum coccineum TaxID=301880 RepID=A0ABQ5DVZ0_9ASTR
MGVHVASQSPSKSTIIKDRTKILIYSFIFILLIFECESSSSKDENRERDALLMFKMSLKNAEAVLRNWNNPPRLPCPRLGSSRTTPPWRGVICLNGNVCGLQLDCLKLSGDIDVDSLLELDKLRTLSLMDNKFEGAMPKFRKLGGTLKSLCISKNNYSGNIDDDAFLGMSSLKRLDIADNRFSGEVPTSLASSMRLLELRIENNRFVGTIPEFPPTLVKFNASNNQLQGRIPPSLCDITDTSAFSGNKDLCGPPLESKCDESGSSSSPNQIVSKANENMSILHVISVIISCLLAIATLVMVYLQLDMKRDGEKDGVTVATTPKGDGKLTFFRDNYGCFDLQDLLRASAEVLGSGNFGSCYKATLMDGHCVVVKRYIHMTNCGKDEFHHHMRTLGNLSHPNLLPLIAYYYRPQEKLLVYKFVHNGSLSKQLHGDRTNEKKAGGLNWPTRLTIIKGVAKGMVYLYKKLPNLLVAHGNLKSSNVLLDKWMQPLLMDYTLLPVVNVEQAHNLMAAFKAPAFCKQGRIDKNLDVWSLGILILETMTSQKLPSTHGSELERWVETIEREKVFDKEMGGTENAQAQMTMLLEIGLKCCKVDEVEKRPELIEVANKIQQLDEKDI